MMVRKQNPSWDDSRLRQEFRLRQLAEGWDLSRKICASGVPTGNGELAKSQFSCSSGAKYVMNWPVAKYYDSYIFYGLQPVLTTNLFDRDENRNKINYGINYIP